MQAHQTKHTEDTRCSDGGCIKADLIEALDHIVNGNGQPGVVKNLSELRTEFREFVSYSKGRDDARAEAEATREREEQRRERKREHWRWALGILLAFVGSLLLWLLSILLPPPLKQKGIISHDTQTYSSNMISTK